MTPNSRSHDNVRADALDWARNEAEAMRVAAKNDGLNLSPASCDQIATWLRLIVEVIEAEGPAALIEDDQHSDLAVAAITTTNRAEAVGDAVSDHLCEHELHAHESTLPAIGPVAGADIVDRLHAAGWVLTPRATP